MTLPEERDLLDAAHELRRAAEPTIDELTRAQLSAARRRALDVRRARVRLDWFGGRGLIATGLALALAGVVWLHALTESTPLQSSETVANLDLLTTSESPDFYSELEFYDWLATEADAT